MAHDSSPPASHLTRRTFVQGTAATLTALAARRVRGANERVQVGFIGYGLIGKRHVVSFKEHEDAELVAVAEAHRGRLAEAREFIGGRVKGHADFRELLADRAVDAVVIAVPDHWHALMTMMACAAGKDVYVEKPMTLFVREGRWMLDVARRHKRVVQVGTQQRSGPHYARAKELLDAGHIGKIVSVRMEAFRNVMPGFGTPPDQAPPADLDWDLFLGPAPLRRYNPNRGIYHFRWFWDTSGGQMTNLGQHALDVVDWYLGGKWPATVMSVGGRFALRDNGETPDTQDAVFAFPGFTAIWSHREVCRGQPQSFGLEFCGTRGTLAIGRSGFLVTPDHQIPPENAIPQFTGAHPVGGPRSAKVEGEPPLWTRSVKDTSGNSREQFKLHARNFLDCIKSREQPVSSLESGYRVATCCHLANLSLKLGRMLRWDAEKETIPNDEEAARLLERPYRKPWDAVLEQLLRG